PLAPSFRPLNFQPGARWSRLGLWWVRSRIVRASGARRNVMAKVGRLSLRNRTVRSESHTRAVRYRIVRGLASADAPKVTAHLACAELDRIWRAACDLTDRSIK